MSQKVSVMPTAYHPVSKDAFRNGMRRLAGACVVIAGSHGDQRAGLTATAVCSITADPPRLLVCVNRDVYAHQVIDKSAKLSINVLSKDQEHIAKRFAGMVEGVQGEERFEEGAWDAGKMGTPVLTDALVSFECQVAEVIAASTHDMFICEVVNIVGEAEEQNPLIFFDGGFSGIV